MSDQMNLWDTPNATSSQASGSGRTRSADADGQTKDLYGPDHAHVSLSALQAKERGLMTSGTFGRIGTGSSSSANLQKFLASKLRQKLGSHGSILYRLTWKTRATPSLRQICALRAAGSRAPKAGSSSRRATAFTDALNFVPVQFSQGKFAILPTTLCKRLMEDITLGSGCIFTLSGWPTPRSSDGKNHARSLNGAESEARRKSWNNDLGVAAFSVIPMMGWGTPTAYGNGLDAETAKSFIEAVMDTK